MKRKTYTIRRHTSVRYTGITEAAKGLGVSRQAISSWLRKGTSLGIANANKIRIVEK